MRTFKLFWTLHKWVGIALSAILLVTAVTGFLLLIKKSYDWIQPPTQRGAEGGPEDYAPLQVVLENVFAQGHPDFRTIDDIERIDFRPDRRVHKLHSRHNHSEFQVDAVTGAILSGPNYRTSDLIEQIHDGSFFGEWMHGWIMPLVAAGLAFLVGSGLWLWIEPILHRRRRKRRAAG